MVRHRVRAVVLAIGLLVSLPAGLVASPAPAKAAPRCTARDTQAPVVRGYSPRTVTVGLKPKTVRFSVKASDDCAVGGWSIDSGKDLVYAYRKHPTDRITPYANSDAGHTSMEVEVYDAAGNLSLRRYDFQLLRATRWTHVDAAPEPVTPGGYVQIVGTLERADWSKGRYVAYGAGRPVTVQFKATGTSTYRTVATTTLDAYATARVSLRVTGLLAREGRYRLAFAGHGVSAPSHSAADLVKVF